MEVTWVFVRSPDPYSSARPRTFWVIPVTRTPFELSFDFKVYNATRVREFVTLVITVLLLALVAVPPPPFQLHTSSRRFSRVLVEGAHNLVFTLRRFGRY